MGNYKEESMIFINRLSNYRQTIPIKKMVEVKQYMKDGAAEIASSAAFVSFKVIYSLINPT